MYYVSPIIYYNLRNVSMHCSCITTNALHIFIGAILAAQILRNYHILRHMIINVLHGSIHSYFKDNYRTQDFLTQ
jgi:hypothetical protein